MLRFQLVFKGAELAAVLAVSKTAQARSTLAENGIVSLVEKGGVRIKELADKPYSAEAIGDEEVVDEDTHRNEVSYYAGLVEKVAVILSVLRGEQDFYVVE